MTGQNSGQPACVVLMGMGEHHCIDIVRIEAQGVHVAQEDVGLAPGVEEHSLLSTLDQAGKAPVGPKVGAQGLVVVENRDADR